MDDRAQRALGRGSSRSGASSWRGRRRRRRRPASQPSSASSATSSRRPGRRRRGGRAAAGGGRRGPRPGGGRPGRRGRRWPPVISTVPSGSSGWGHGQHDLADVAALAQVAEGATARRGRPRRAIGEWAQGSGGEQVDAAQRGSRRCARARPRRGRRRGRRRRGGRLATCSASRRSVLPISRKRPPRGSSSSEASTNSPARESRTTSIPSPVGGGEELLLEVEVAGGGDVVVVEAELAQRLPLGGAGGGEDLGAEVPGDLDRRHADAAGAGVDQDPLARPEAGEVDQPVLGGHVDDRHGGALRRTTSRRAAGRGSSASATGQRAEGAWHQARSPGRPAARSSTPAPTSMTTPAPSPPIAGLRGRCRARSGRRGS